MLSLTFGTIMQSMTWYNNSVYDIWYKYAVYDIWLNNTVYN